MECDNPCDGIKVLLVVSPVISSLLISSSLRTNVDIAFKTVLYLLKKDSPCAQPLRIKSLVLLADVRSSHLEISYYLVCAS